MDQALLTSDPDAPAEAPWVRTRIRVPRKDGAILALPNSSCAQQVAERNSSEFASTDSRIAGVPFSDLRAAARREVIDAAVDWTGRILRRPVDADADRVIFATGHQPDLFHTGVWIKNLAVAELASRSSSVGVNLIVDTDVAGPARIRVPAGSQQHPMFDFVDYDIPQEVEPWEEKKIVDRNTFDSFGDRVSQAMRKWHVDPVINSIWPYAIEQSQDSDVLWECLAAARIRMEHDRGVGNLELPMSEMCRLDSFLTLTVSIISDAVRFRDIYNRTLEEFRNVNHIRSQTHPVPALRAAGDWIETPFWIWHSTDTIRKRLFVSNSGDEVRLATDSNEESTFCRFNVSEETGSCIDILHRLAAKGIRLRPRALMTTLFARLLLSDLFIHGIGGAKYDEMTDRLLARFFGIQPPGFMTLSATNWLPFAKPLDVELSDRRRINRMLLELQHNPQAHISNSSDPEIQKLIDEKTQLIAEQHVAKQRRLTAHQVSRSDNSGRQRYRRIPEINRRLANGVSEQKDRLLRERAEVERQLAANEVLKHREFSFCLYPESRIASMIEDLRARIAKND